jgi:hypothetical protein
MFFPLGRAVCTRGVTDVRSESGEISDQSLSAYLRIRSCMICLAAMRVRKVELLPENEDRFAVMGYLLVTAVPLSLAITGLWLAPAFRQNILMHSGRSCARALVFYPQMAVCGVKRAPACLTIAKHAMRA